MKRIAVKLTILAMAISVLAVVTGCYGMGVAPFSPPRGVIYSEFKAPLSLDTQGKDLGSKKGEATNQSFLALVTIGDIDVNSVAQKAGITKIKHTDYKYRNILLILQETTVIVYGD